MQYIVILLLLLAPISVFGATFAKQSLFLSRPSVTEGETVLIHAVVNNDSAAAFAGTMFFSEGAAAIGTAPVSLEGGEAAAVSVSWKPLSGSHTVVAELKVGAEVVEKQSATFTIAPKPLSATATSTQAVGAVESSDAIQESIAGLSPQAAGALAPVFTLVDGGRSKAADILDSQIESTRSVLGPTAGQPSEVLGAEDVKQAGSNPMGAFWYIAQTLYLYLLTILRFLVGSAGVFYPALALLFLFLLWKIFRRFRRPAY